MCKKRNLLSQSSLRLITAAAFFLSFTSQAVLIEYDVTDLGGNQFQYDYTITNNSLAAGLEEFSVFFDQVNTVSVDELSALTPTDWDGYVFQPDPFLPDDGVFGAFAIAAPLALGQSLSGFSVVIEWVGQMAPAEQFYEVYNLNFDVVASGDTLDVNRNTPIPSPATMLLFGLGLLAMSRKSSR